MRWLDGITDSWVWVDSGSWWWTGRPGVLRSTGSQRVGLNWATELNWTLLNSFISLNSFFSRVFRIFYTHDLIICKQRSFYFFFSNLDAFYFFFLLWLKVPLLCWMEVKVGILVLFLILKKKFSVFAAVCFSCMVFIAVIQFTFCLYFVACSLSWKGAEFCQMFFLYQLR